MSQQDDSNAPTEHLIDTSTQPVPERDASATASEPLKPTVERGRPARFGTILWGVVLLIFAGAMLVGTVTEVRIDALGWITGGLIATGAILVIAGIAAAVRRRP